jgi:small subunit ribosomal protein S2
MSVISMKLLLESGVHFGHRTHKWDPHMKPYIFTERNKIHILDLQKTAKAIEEAFALVRDKVAEGGMLLFIGTKRQSQDTIQGEAIRCGMPYVTNRWLGGMLTNWKTIQGRVRELERLERMREKGDFERLTKKEALLLNRKIDRLESLLGGIRSLTALPDMIFVVDVRREATAIHEANLLNIPVIGMVDTNCDPRDIDFVIPSNDDAIRAIKLIVGKVADAVLEGQMLRKDKGGEYTELELAAQRQAAVSMEEPYLSDEELLGEATLRKLNAMAKFTDIEELAGVDIAPADVAPEDVVSVDVIPADDEKEKEEAIQGDEE